MTTSDVFVYDAIRTPFGRHGGALADSRPDDLAALVIRALIERAPGLDPARVDEIILGNANGAGEENRNVARMAGLLADLPTSVPATTVNRLCGSSLDAAIIASRQIAVGEADVVIAGGVESMSRAPWVLVKPDKPFPSADAALASTTLGWRLVNPAMPAEWTVSLGEATEQLRERERVTREQQDAFALRSHQKAAAAWAAGFYADQVVPVPGTGLARDESIRDDTSLGKLAALKPAFRADGTVTAGNASPLTDGASTVLLGSASARGVLGLEPLARIAGRGAAANDPQYFGFAPVEAANLALKRAGIGWADVGAVELNEAFAAQSVACIKAWGIDPHSRPDPHLHGRGGEAVNRGICTAPSRQIASREARSSGRLPMRTATRSPSPTPRPARADPASGRAACGVVMASWAGAAAGSGRRRGTRPRVPAGTCRWWTG